VWNTYIAVESADATAARIRDAGGRVVAEPTDVLDAGRMGVFADPTGAVFSVWEARQHIGAQLVNEPGTWVLNELNTRDPASAAAFYRTVFGWEVESFGVGEGGFTMLRRPGYGDFLAQSDPEIRERQEADGAPAGYADAVAFVMELTDEQPDVPAHWSVTFATDDADATAARAEALGGTVVVPPFDAEPVRMTVLTDPQGAQFTATKYQPGAASA
jgi:predicted enzyme related to lactoylglutathione lyase